MAVREEFRGDLGLEGRDSVTATWDRSCSIRSEVPVRPQPRWLVRDVEDQFEFTFQSVVREKPKRITLRLAPPHALPTIGVETAVRPCAGSRSRSGEDSCRRRRVSDGLGGGDAESSAVGGTGLTDDDLDVTPERRQQPE